MNSKNKLERCKDKTFIDDECFSPIETFGYAICLGLVCGRTQSVHS